jgi:glutamate 5-kinase
MVRKKRRGMSKRTIVVKVGSSTVTGADGRVDREFLGRLIDQIGSLRAEGYLVALVSSGAIAAGLEALALLARPKDMPTVQATAAVGQVRLIETYAELAAERGMNIGQVLFTRQDVSHRQQYLNACHTLERLLEMGILPIVNENDTTAVDEIRFGDNDYLAALVGIMLHADAVVLLTDIEGLYSSDPRQDSGARLVERVEELTDELLAAAGGAGSLVGDEDRSRARAHGCGYPARCLRRETPRRRRRCGRGEARRYPVRGRQGGDERAQTLAGLRRSRGGFDRD